MKQIRVIAVTKRIMKTSSIIVATLLTLTPAAGLHAATESAVGSQVQVNFFEPEKFRDVGRTHMASDRDRDGDLAVIQKHLIKQARHYLPEGYRLEVTFTDVDMAGEFEPWRGPQWSDVRIVKDIYAPRMELTFRVTDPDGNVVNEGKRVLRDSAFLMKLSIDRSDAYRHEKELLNDWLRSEFPRERHS